MKQNSNRAGGVRRRRAHRRARRPATRRRGRRRAGARARPRSRRRARSSGCRASATNCAGACATTSRRTGPSRPTRCATRAARRRCRSAGSRHFCPGEGMGGAANHWNGQTWRWAEYDPILRTRLADRYGAEGDTRRHADSGLGRHLREMEPYHELFEQLFGIAGKAGNIQGQIQPGGNPFEAPRRGEYPQPPLEITEAGLIFKEGARSSATSRSRCRPPTRRVPTPIRTACGSAPANTAVTASASSAKPSQGLAQVLLYPMLQRKPGFEIRARSHVLGVDYDRQGKARHGRALPRPRERRGIRAASRHRGAGGIHDDQHQAAADGRHRRAVGPGDGPRRRRREFLPPDECRRINVFFKDRWINPFMAAGLLADGDRRVQQRQLRSRRPRLSRRRLHLQQHHQRPADLDPAVAARHAALGHGVEAGERGLVRARVLVSARSAAATRTSRTT